MRPVNSLNFSEEVLKAAEPVVADLYADWCGPCRALAPLLEHYADTYAGRVKFVKVNVDEETELAERFQISAIPMILIFQDAELLKSFIGIPDPEEFAELLSQLAQHRINAN